MNVGDYIRTKDGALGKIIDKYKINDYYKIKVDIRNGWIEKHREDLFKKHIIKSSPQIINLIEVGDYVNGLRVEKNKYGDLYISYVYYGGDIGKQCEVYTNWVKEMQEDDIYTIVTHEQMETTQYRVEE